MPGLEGGCTEKARIRVKRTRDLAVQPTLPGFALIKAIRAQGAHLLMRIKSDIALPLVRALPDGSYQSFLSNGACCIPVRVVEYDVRSPAATVMPRMNYTRWPPP